MAIVVVTGSGGPCQAVGVLGHHGDRYGACIAANDAVPGGEWSPGQFCRNAGHMVKAVEGSRDDMTFGALNGSHEIMGAGEVGDVGAGVVTGRIAAGIFELTLIDSGIGRTVTLFADMNGRVGTPVFCRPAMTLAGTGAVAVAGSACCALAVDGA